MDTPTPGASPQGNPHPPRAPFNPVPTTPPPGMTSPTLSSQPPGGSSGVQNPGAGGGGGLLLSRDPQRPGEVGAGHALVRPPASLGLGARPRLALGGWKGKPGRQKGGARPG